MGRQVRLRLLPEDLAEIEQGLRERQAAFIEYYLHAPELSLSSTLAHRVNREPMLWLAREQDLPQVRLVHVPTQGYWVVEPHSSPVVELVRGNAFDGTRVPSGRLWFASEHYDSDTGTVHPPPPDFVEWAQSLLRWARRHFSRDRETGDYWGSQALAWRGTQAGG